MRKIFLIFLVLIGLMLACKSDQVTNPPINPPGILLSQVATITAISSIGDSTTWDIVCAITGQEINLDPTEKGLVFYATGSPYEVGLDISNRINGSWVEFRLFFYTEGVLPLCPAQWSGNLLGSCYYRGGCGGSTADAGYLGLGVNEYTIVVFPVAPYRVKILGVQPSG